MRDSASIPTSRRGLVTSVRGVFYGWWLVGIASFMLTLMSLTVFQGVGTLLVALERQFGWSRTALSGAFALARAEGAVLGPIEGFLVDRVGTRRMTLIGYVIMAAGFVLQSRVNSLWQFYVAFIVIALGSGLGGWLAMIAMVNNWFNRRRSIAMASAMSGAHFGGLLVPLFAYCIEVFEFRAVSLGIGVFMLLIIGPVVKVIRNHPEEYGMRPDGDPPAGERDGSERESDAAMADGPEFTVRQALRTPVFWLLTAAQVASSVAIVSISLHLSPKLTDMGMSLTGAGVVTSVMVMAALPSQFLAGFLADRLPKPPLIAFLLFLQSSAILLLALNESETTYLPYVFAIVYGIGFGGRMPLTTAIRGEYFGRRSFATIMGVSQLPMNIGMIFAPLYAGYMFDTTGTYLVPFTVFAALSFSGAVLMLFVKRPAPPARVGARVLGGRGVG